MENTLLYLMCFTAAVGVVSLFMLMKLNTKVSQHEEAPAARAPAPARAAPAAPSAPAAPAATVPAEAPAKDSSEEEIVAVIAAAIACMNGQTPVIRITRVSRTWTLSGRIQRAAE